MIRFFFRSGWWVLAAALIVLVVFLMLVLRPGSADQTARSVQDPTHGFDLRCPIDGPIVSGGMGRDPLHPVDDPAFIPGAEVAAVNEHQRGKLLVGDDRVIGVVLGGRARAYPIRLLRWHEVVNDRLGSTPIAVTYSGLCDAPAVWKRPVVDGRPITFGLSGLLLDSNTLLYDRTEAIEDATLWSQLSGQAVAGPQACASNRLDAVSFEVALWSEWLARHPSTEVLTPKAELKRLYKRNPYHSYFGDDTIRFPVEPSPPPGGPAAKDSVVIIESDRRRAVFSIPDLARSAGRKHGVAERSFEGRRIRIHFGLEPATARIEDPEAPSVPATARIAFWFAWHARFPSDTVETE